MKKNYTIKEKWKPVKGYEKLYEVSNLGNVRNHKRILKASKQTKGYYQVILTKNNEQHHFLVHRLVAMAFIEKPIGFDYVNHIDEIKHNNYINNLEWVNHQMNIVHGTRLGKIRKPVFQYNTDLQLIKKYASGTDAEKDGFCGSAISQCCHDKRNSHKGFIWSFCVIDVYCNCVESYADIA
jgi:hypothetical protein